MAEEKTEQEIVNEKAAQELLDELAKLESEESSE